MSELSPLDQLKELRHALEPFLKHTSPPAAPEAWAKDQAAANAQLHKLEAAITKTTMEGRIAKYESLDEWSRHYSIARMTVVPFGITTAIAILSWGWDRVEVIPTITLGQPHGIPIFPALALIVGIATMLLMGALTYSTYKKGTEMLEAARQANISRGSSKSLLRRILADIPLWACVIASLGFLGAYYCQLSKFTGHASPAEIRLVKPDLDSP